MCIKGFALILRTGSNRGTIPSINGEHPIVKSSVDMGIHVGTGIFLQDTFIFNSKLRVERNNIICYWVYYDVYALLINAICLPPPLYASCPWYIALWLVVLHLLSLPQPLHTHIPLFFAYQFLWKSFIKYQSSGISMLFPASITLLFPIIVVYMFLALAQVI